MKKIILIFMIFMVIFSSSSCNRGPFSTETESIESDQIPHDLEYKLFYGDWIITKKIAEHMREDPEKGDLSGTKISYRKDLIVFDTTIVDEKDFYYDIALIPITEIPFFDYLDNPVEIGLEGSYFAFVNVRIKDYSPQYIGRYFYVKDDATLIIFDDFCYYEAERVAYIENHNSFLQHY